jgi:hypothetical protein
MMRTFDVSQREWPEFLVAFGREHRAWLATIKRSFRDSTGTVDATEQPLAEIDMERAGEDIRAIHIRLGPHIAPHTDLRIPRPLTVRVEQTDGGADRALEIVDGDGGCTRVAFCRTALPEMLDGMAPGEA